MPRLIDKRCAIKHLEEMFKNSIMPTEWHEGVKTAITLLQKEPTVEAEPIRHGHWCVTQAYPHTIYCSECFQRFAQAHWAVWKDGSLPRDYCPHCGAKMDEVEDG